MEKNEALFKTTLEELSTLGKRMESIAEVEATFEVKMRDLEERIDSLFDAQKGIIDDIAHLQTALDDLNAALSGTEALERKIHELESRLGELDIQGLGQKLDDAVNEISKATSKLTAAEKRKKEAEQKKTIGKK